MVLEMGTLFQNILLKKYLFDKIDNEIKYIKAHARVDKIKLSKPDLKMCIWVCFKQFRYGRRK